MLDRQKVRTFVIGGIAGALAGILLAPRSGKELRGSISSRANEARERGRESYFEAQERARERLAETRDRPVTGPAAPHDDSEDLVGYGAPRSDFGSPTGSPAPPGEASGPTSLRDVSRDASESTGPVEPGGDPEELRRRIRETRSRLRARLDEPGTGPESDRDV